MHDIGGEGIHLRSGSSDNVVRDSAVHDTGVRRASYGEGIYVGSETSNWSTGGSLSGNTFDGTGMSGANYADSWV